MTDEVLWLDEHRVVSLAELVEVSGLSEAELLELVQVGVIPVREARGATVTTRALKVYVAPRA